ncbi:MAG: hypothetical protein JW791_01970 [Nanoarchaeota archaeon]|nr:hypothetical protein [Nanoarchaeota archaeon]
MGVEQIIIKGEANLGPEEFNSIFKPLNSGFCTVDAHGSNNWRDYVKRVKSSSENIGVIIMEKKLENLFYFSKKHNLMYINMPDLNNKKQAIFIKNVYLYLLAREHLVATGAEIEDFFEKFMAEGLDTSNCRRDILYGVDVIAESHKPSDCVVNTKIFLYDEKDSIFNKFLKMDGICYNCYIRLPEDVRENFINGLLISSQQGISCVSS